MVVLTAAIIRSTLLHSGDYIKVQVAEELEVSRYTLWRALSQEAAK